MLVPLLGGFLFLASLPDRYVESGVGTWLGGRISPSAWISGGLLIFLCVAACLEAFRRGSWTDRIIACAAAPLTFWLIREFLELFLLPVRHPPNPATWGSGAIPSLLVHIGAPFLSIGGSLRSQVMLSIALQIVMVASFAALLVFIWRVSKWPRWRIRAIVYGWAAVFFWAFLWAILLPMSLRGVMDAHKLAATFPDGTIAMAALVGGWFWPAVMVAISSFQGRKKRGSDHVA